MGFPAYGKGPFNTSAFPPPQFAARRAHATTRRTRLSLELGALETPFGIHERPCQTHASSSAPEPTPQRSSDISATHRSRSRWTSTVTSSQGRQIASSPLSTTSTAKPRRTNDGQTPGRAPGGTTGGSKTFLGLRGLFAPGERLELSTNGLTVGLVESLTRTNLRNLLSTG